MLRVALAGVRGGPWTYGNHNETFGEVFILLELRLVTSCPPPNSRAQPFQHLVEVRHQHWQRQSLDTRDVKGISTGRDKA
ncbi:hypothetical protein RRG08_048566 [Elysia crispata]|uniref:Uncharacterized protein n=1 Tax=Elysia crispata TaxID=231223 RepID=A0AAE1EBF8_9GAST|nr:hypothetical protein RRG08_048566 [Elysia crispata]